MWLKSLAMAAVASGLVAGPALAASDASFIRKAIQGDNSEMRLGALATQRGASQEVRAFGDMLQRDHAMARRQAVPLARELGVRPGGQMAPAAIREQMRLNRLSGRAFDMEFARYMVSDHMTDIQDFERQARTRGPTAVLARQTLPTLRKHLQMAESIRR